jgi:hypothetical protein
VDCSQAHTTRQTAFSGKAGAVWYFVQTHKYKPAEFTAKAAIKEYLDEQESLRHL